MLTTLVALQWLMTWLTTRSRRFEWLISAPPRLLLYDGVCLTENMRRERVTEEQLRAKVREHGYSRLGDVGAVVIETSGSMSVLAREESDGAEPAHGSEDAAGPPGLGRMTAATVHSVAHPPDCLPRGG